MDIKKTIYFHIGMPKTGTSSIQHFLYDNREQLIADGIFYPVSGENEDGLPSYMVPWTNFRRILDVFVTKGEDSFKKMWETEYLAQINNSTCPIVLFSEELLFFHRTDIIRTISEYGFNVKVIFYVRRPVEYLSSLWGEGVKSEYRNSNDTMSLQEFLLQKEIDFSIIHEYINLFGSENVIIRPFDKQQWEGQNLLSDFLQCLSCKFHSGFVEAPRENDSLNRNLSELCLIINHIRLDDADHSRIKREILGLTSTQSPKIIDTMSDELIKTTIDKNLHNEHDLASLIGKNSFFENDYPYVYGKERDDYNKICLNNEELGILYKAIALKNNYSCNTPHSVAVTTGSCRTCLKKIIRKFTSVFK